MGDNSEDEKLKEAMVYVNNYEINALKKLLVKKKVIKEKEFDNEVDKEIDKDTEEMVNYIG